MSHGHEDDRKGAVEHYGDYWRIHYERMQRGYNDPAAQQQAFFVGLHIQDVLEALRGDRGPRPLRVLNAGCGQGTWSVPMAQAGIEVVNLDASVDAVRLTRDAFARSGYQGYVLGGNMLQLPFSDHSFDGVVNFGVLEHFEDLKCVFQELARVLKPGGILHVEIITDRFCVQTVQGYINVILSVVWNILRLRWGRVSRVLQNPHKGFYENSYSSDEYEGFMRSAGLEAVRSRGVRAFPFVALPRWADGWYAALLRGSARPLRDFDRSGSPWSKWWGAIWTVTGAKPAACQNEVITARPTVAAGARIIASTTGVTAPEE